MHQVGVGVQGQGEEARGESKVKGRKAGGKISMSLRCLENQNQLDLRVARPAEKLACLENQNQLDLREARPAEKLECLES